MSTLFTQQYTVKLDQFEGPLDLLLELIENERLEITKVSLAKVADQYLQYLKNFKDIKPECLAYFLTIVARLVLLKSKALLPVLELTDEEEEDIDELQKRLEEYKIFRNAGRKLGEIAKQGQVSFSREGFWGQDTLFLPPKNVAARDLEKAFKKILAEIPTLEILPQEKLVLRLSLEEKIKKIQESLKERVEANFEEIYDKKSKVDVIVSFLALLELVKQQLVMVRQRGMFGEIRLKKIK